MRKSNCYFSKIGYILGLQLFCLAATHAQSENTYAYNRSKSFIQQENFQAYSAKPNETVPRHSLSDFLKGLKVLNIEIAPNIISGKVTTSDGGPAARVTVFIKGTKKGTSTNNEGVFTIDAKKGDILVFSFVGFQTKEVMVGDETTLNVVLTAANQELNTVVVTALGIKKQARAIGYSTTQIDGSKFTESRETNIGNALTGQIAGVSVAGVSTGPYGSSRVLIRGNSSLTGNNQPLYVVDNIPYDNSNQGNAGMWGGADYGDGLTNINPDDIESITVLKGVAATALYGYRGGNGAILITTKSGNKSRGIGVEVNNNLTFSNFIDERDYQYVYGQGSLGIKPTNITTANATTEQSWGAKIDGSDAVNSFGNHYPYNAVKDNYKNFFKTGLNNQTSVALLGSNDKGHFRLGLSNLYLNSNVPNSDMKQQGINFNTTYNITPKLQFTLTANYLFEDVKNRASFSDAPGNLIASNQFIANTYDIRWLKARVDSNRNELLPGNQDIYFENPYFIANDDLNETNRNRLTAGLTVKYNILDWWYVQGSLTRDGYIFNTKQVTPNGVQYSNAGGGNISMSEINQHELDGNILTGINKKIGKNFVMNAAVGAYSQDNVWKSFSGGGGPFVIPYFYSISNVSSKPFNYGFSHSRVNSVYGNVDVGFKDFLFLSVTGRNDWFSVLNPKTNNYFYPSISGSFVFSDALSMPAWINFGKLRASYGGSSNTGAANAYETLLTYGLQGYTTNGQAVGFVVNGSIPNQALRPVSIQEEEVGFNIEFLNSRLGIDLALYNKNTTDDIVNVSVSGTSGYGTNVINVGKMRNRGIEILLTGTPIKSRDFAWNVSWNFAYNSNRVLYLAGKNYLSLDVPRNGDASIRAVVGLPYGQIVGYKYKRNSAGSIVYDTAGLPLASDGVQPFGSGVYDKTGGITNDFHYKDFALSFLIDYKFGGKLYSGTNLILYSDGLQKGTLEGRETGFIGKGVTEDGHPNTKVVITQNYFGAIAAGSNNIDEQFVYDASFIKLRALSLTYNLPKSILKSGFIKGCSLSLVGRNLAILLKHTPNIDPESTYNNTNAQGLELSGYPSVRSYGFNLNVKF
jgi:TonB-linked SusC/RagA family outer membrane protein